MVVIFMDDSRATEQKTQEPRRILLSPGRLCNVFSIFEEKSMYRTIVFGINVPQLMPAILGCMATGPWNRQKEAPQPMQESIGE